MLVRLCEIEGPAVVNMCDESCILQDVFFMQQLQYAVCLLRSPCIRATDGLAYTAHTLQHSALVHMNKL